MSEKTPNSGVRLEPATERPPGTAARDSNRPGLLANISHELRTPMDAILGYVELLTETPLNDTQQTFISAIERAAKGLLDIMEDVLNLSTLEAGKLVLHNQPFSIHECLDSVAQMLAPSAYRKGLDFIRVVDNDVALNYIGDPLRIRQVLVNLVGNAIKFTQDGSVRVTVTALKGSQSDELLLRVTDTGIGITSADLTKLFEPFSQPAKPQGDIAGTGLGLVISKSLCEAMGGTITVQSTAGAGSSFSANLPLESLDDTFHSGDGSDLPGGRVVIACDDDEQAGWLADNLRQDGASTRIVADLRQLALEISENSCSEDIALSVINADILEDIEQLRQDWQPAVGKLPILNLVSTVSGHTLKQVGHATAGDCIPAHSSALTITRHLATLLQQHSESTLKVSDEPQSLSQPLKGLHLLVAEDNQFGRDYLQMLLRRHGATVDVCSDGQDACHMIAEHHYDLVLMDVRMPDCDGIEAMKKLADSNQTLPPIIGLTAAPEECCRALDSGMTDCLLKPIRPAVLLNYISNYHNSPALESAAPLSFIDKEMRQELNRELPRRATDLLAAITRGDMNVALDEAHKLNGTAALCGFAKLHSSAATIEGLIRQRHLDGIEPLARELSRQVDEVLASLISS